MIIQIFFNTDGFLGGWANPPSCQKLKPQNITKKNIKESKVSGYPLHIDVTSDELMIFHNVILGRDNIEILATNEKTFDLEVGNLKIKFNDNQSDKLLREARAAHALTFRDDTHKLNEDEKMIKEIYKVDLISNTTIAKREKDALEKESKDKEEEIKKIKEKIKKQKEEKENLEKEKKKKWKEEIKKDYFEKTNLKIEKLKKQLEDNGVIPKEEIEESEKPKTEKT